MWQCHLAKKLEACAKEVRECATWALHTRERREAKPQKVERGGDEPRECLKGGEALAFMTVDFGGG